MSRALLWTPMETKWCRSVRFDVTMTFTTTVFRKVTPNNAFDRTTFRRCFAAFRSADAADQRGR